jgi:hypothetical protein
VETSAPTVWFYGGPETQVVVAGDLPGCGEYKSEDGPFVITTGKKDLLSVEVTTDGEDWKVKVIQSILFGCRYALYTPKEYPSERDCYMRTGIPMSAVRLLSKFGLPTQVMKVELPLDAAYEIRALGR